MKLKKMIRNLIKNPWFYLSTMMLLMALLFIFGNITPLDDAFLYQSFAEKIVNQGEIDLSIAGFHGADFFVAIIYFFTHSSFSVYYLDIILAILSIPLFFLVFKKIFNNALLGLLVCFWYMMSPHIYTNAFRGGHQTSFLFFTLLGLFFLFYKPKYSFIFGISYIIKPFSIALAPIFLYKKQYKQLLLSFIFPITYMITQYFQIGRLIIGSHSDLAVGILFSFKRFVLNIVYAFQNYFSIHGFSPINNVYFDDMIRISPLITFFAIFAIFYHKQFFKNTKFYWFVLLSTTIGFVIPTSFFRFDYNYYLIFDLTLVLLSLPPIIKYYKFLPLIVFSLFFQFFYSFLANPTYFSSIESKIILFFIPVYILIISLFFVYYKVKHHKNIYE